MELITQNINFEQRLQYGLKAAQYLCKLVKFTDFNVELEAVCNKSIGQFAFLRKVLRLFESVSLVVKMLDWKKPDLIRLAKVVTLLFNLFDHLLLFKEKIRFGPIMVKHILMARNLLWVFTSISNIAVLAYKTAVHRMKIQNLVKNN